MKGVVPSSAYGNHLKLGYPMLLLMTSVMKDKLLIMHR